MFFTVLAAAGMLLSGSAIAAQWGPVWQGPRQRVEWKGMSAAEASKPAAPAVVAPAGDDTPRWVGYVNRSTDEWWFRLILSNQKSEMVKKGAMTSDGWRVTAFQAQVNRPTSVTVSKNGIEKVLELTAP